MSQLPILTGRGDSDTLSRRVQAPLSVVRSLFQPCHGPSYTISLDVGELTPTSCFRYKNLFALVVGINKYKDLAVNPLKGAVADAKAVCDFLRDVLRVPAENIRCITDGTATRSSILQNLVQLQLDSRINPGNPIFIFYAGHGGEAMPPSKWGQSRVQTIIPHDFGTIVNGSTVPSIPDRTIGALLGHLADLKGNNIVRLSTLFQANRSTYMIPRRLYSIVAMLVLVPGRPTLVLVSSLDPPISPKPSQRT